MMDQVAMDFSIPFSRDENFFDRSGILEDLNSKHGVTFLHGPSGVGYVLRFV